MSYARWEQSRCACPRYLADDCLAFRTGRDLRDDDDPGDYDERCECSCHDDDDDDDDDLADSGDTA
jgi:hypothetical protein